MEFAAIARAFSRAACLALAVAPVAAAQAPAPPRTPDMQAIAQALGVQCEYCHVPRGAATRPAATGKPRFEVAREMIAMTADLNARVEAAAGKAAADTTRVECVTCHRGVAIPRQLRDVIWQTTMRQGPDAAVALYRDLRARYHGRQSYDFGEETLAGIADRLAQARPEAAVALADLNLEFYPRSVPSLVAKAIAESRQSDPTPAIVSLRKALELDPDNYVAKGWLIQMEERANRRR